MVEEVEFVTSLQCQEELETKCHTSYVTRYALVTPVLISQIFSVQNSEIFVVFVCEIFSFL